jgi:hypothetical protein
MSYPYYEPTVHGDILSRVNLFRYIREHLYNSRVQPGYYLEFGVLNGDSMFDAFATMRGMTEHYVGFDSFAGLPEFSDEDREAAHLMPFWQPGTIRGSSRERVHDHLAGKGVPRDKVTLIEGYYEDSLPKTDARTLFAGKGDCHVCLVDCDLHSSSKLVFEYIEPLLVTGTWLLLDDYWCYRGDPRHGQRRAFEEFLAQSQRIGVSEWGNFRGWGKAFLVYEK